MSEQREETSGDLRRRQFMLRATSALGAAALAGLLGGPDVAAGAAPTGESQGGGLFQGLGTMQFTVHQDEPAITLVDGGQSGHGAADAFYFSADLHLTPGGPVVGQVLGTKSVMKTPGGSATEPRITQLFFTSNDRQDQIVVAGIADYPVEGAQFEVDQAVVRAIVGGTGIFLGARGQLTSTRHPSGGYTQVFTLAK